MPLADFIHLRVHTAYSLSAGAIKIKELVGLCKKNSMPAVAITDSGNLFGALEFATACAGEGVQPIIGCEIALVAHEANERQLGQRDLERIVLLVQSEAGYRNLLALVTRSFLDSDAGADPAIALSDLAIDSEGLLCLTGGAKGPLGRLIADGQDYAAGVLLDALKDTFPGRLYIELTRHGTPEEARTENGFVDLAYKHDLPLVATNDAYFPDRDYYEAHDALLCIAQGKVVADSDRRRLTP
ncbi:MAG: PHP domain-containing protein, partial [Stellaceae bacterium]